MNPNLILRFGVAGIVGVLLMLTGCEAEHRSTARSDDSESVLAVAVDRGTAVSGEDAHRIVLRNSGEAAVGWSRNPSSMRRTDRLTESQKAEVLRAANAAVGKAHPGEYEFGSKEGDWIRVVIITDKRKLIFDESAKKDAPAPPAEVKLIIDSLLSQADR